jgi:hypothetical protein
MKLTRWRLFWFLLAALASGFDPCPSCNAGVAHREIPFQIKVIICGDWPHLALPSPPTHGFRCVQAILSSALSIGWPLLELRGRP